MKTIIGITPDYSYELQKYTISQYYIEAVKKAGACPVVLFDDFPQEINGIILTGGGDVNPLLFGEEPLTENGEICPKRDAFELKLCKWAISQKIPMLGICRGMQIIALCSGGSIYQDIYTQTDSHIKHMQKAPRSQGTHTIEITEESLLHSIFQQKSEVVNSFHHQCIRILGAELNIAAVASDGIIEAIESDCLPFVVGVQWHPECMWKTSLSMGELFHVFIEKSKNAKNLQYISPKPRTQ